MVKISDTFFPLNNIRIFLTFYLFTAILRFFSFFSFLFHALNFTLNFFCFFVLFVTTLMFWFTWCIHCYIFVLICYVIFIYIYIYIYVFECFFIWLYVWCKLAFLVFGLVDKSWIKPYLNLNLKLFHVFIFPETSGDFDWAIEQIEEKTLNLKDKGYNGKEIRVVEGKGAKMLYSDAQVRKFDMIFLWHINKCYYCWILHKDVRTWVGSTFNGFKQSDHPSVGAWIKNVPVFYVLLVDISL